MRLLRKQCGLVFIAFICSVACVAVVFLFVPVVRIDQQTCDQISAGMTVAQAEAVIGVEPGWYDGVYSITVAPSNNVNCHYWFGGRGEIRLEFDDYNRVLEARFIPADRSEQSVPKLLTERLTELFWHG